MLPRLDRLTLHARAARTDAYVPCAPGQDGPVRAFGWLQEHPEEVDPFTQESLAEPVGEDSVAYWNALVWRWGADGAKVPVPIPDDWLRAGPHSIQRVSPMCTAPGQRVEYVRKITLYLALLSQRKQYPYGIDVGTPPNTNKQGYPLAYKGRGQFQELIMPFLPNGSPSSGPEWSEQFEEVLESFLDECEYYDLYDRSKDKGQVGQNPFPQGAGGFGAQEKWVGPQGQVLDWHDRPSEIENPNASVSENTRPVDVAALIEALQEALQTAEDPGTRWHRLLMVYNVMGIKDDDWEFLWPNRELQFMRHPFGLSTLVKLINDNVDGEGAWWRNEMSFNFVRDALKTLHRVFAEPISTHAWVRPDSLEVSAIAISGGTLQALLKALNNVNFKDRKFNDVQKYCVKILSALVLSSPKYQEAENLLIRLGGMQILARAFSLTRGRALKGLIKLLNRLWGSNRHSWNQTLITTLQSNDEVLARLVRLSCTLPQSEIIDVDEEALRQSAIAMGLDQLQLPGDADFGDGVKFLARVTEHALALLRTIDQVDADNTYFRWRAMGDKYYYLNTATYGIQFLAELSSAGTKEQKDDALDTLFQLSKRRANLAFFVVAEVIYRLIEMLNLTPQDSLTDETKAKVARVLVEIVAHCPNEIGLGDSVDRIVISQFDEGYNPSYLLEYWERLNPGPGASRDTRQYQTMLESLTRLSSDFNSYTSHHIFSRPGVPDPRYYEFD